MRARVIALAVTSAVLALVAARSSDAQTTHGRGLLRGLFQGRDAARTDRAEHAAESSTNDSGAAANVGFRTIALGAGRTAAVWYPTTAAESKFTYANGVASSVAVDAPPVASNRLPLVLFSHGFGGCSLQSLFLTETLARHGYVVAAPDHADARCRGAGEHAQGFTRPDEPFRDPNAWTDRTYADRAGDLAAVLHAVLDDAALARIVDETRLGVAGHSLGGYTAMGVAGGWPAWTLPHVRAALLLSPYVSPFMAHERIAAVHVPVMYQGGSRDLGISPGIRRPGGAYDASPPPKCYVELDGVGHLGWTNLACRGKSTRACVAGDGGAALIARYALAFLDRHLKDARGPSALDATAAGLSTRRCAEQLGGL